MTIQNDQSVESRGQAMRPALNVMSFIHRGSGLLLTVSSIAMIALIVIVVADVTLRTTGNGAVNGSIEYVSQWLLPTIVLFSLAAAERNEEHIRVTILEEYLHESARRVLATIARSCIAIIAVTLFIFSCIAAQDAFVVRESVPMGTGELEIWPVKIMITVAWLWFACQCVANLFLEVLNVDSREAVAQHSEGDVS